jgi:hypothetical protein
MEDTTTYTLGLGQKLAANWSGLSPWLMTSAATRPHCRHCAPPMAVWLHGGGELSARTVQAHALAELPASGLGDISSGGTTLAFDAESATAFGIRLGYQF